MSQDEQNLNLLAIFHYVVGGMTMLFSLFFGIYIAMGIAMLLGKFDGNDAPPAFMGWLFVGIGSVCLLCGWGLGIMMIIAGRRLKAHVSRMFCLVIAGIECILTPFGTVLGIFTIITLMKESVQQIFAANSR